MVLGDKMRKIIFIFIVLLVCGCTANYNLEITEESFKETIDIKISKSLIPEKSEYPEIETDDYITPFLEEETSALFSNPNVYYNKQVQDFSTYYNIKMDYEYLPSEFKDSNSLNLCFDNFEFYEDENYYLHATGTFYCLYSDEVKINITTKNEVITNNADEIKGNTYIWNINGRNKNNIDIEFEVSKKISYMKYIKYGLLIILLVGIIYLINKLLTKNKINNEI